MTIDYLAYGEKIGLVSPLHSLTIINANDRFASHSKVLDDFIKNKIS